MDKRTKAKIFFLIFLFPAILTANTMVFASTGSTGAAPGLATFLSYLASVLEVMALVALRRDVTYGLTLAVAGVIVALLTSGISGSGGGSSSQLNSGVMHVCVNVLQWYCGATGLHIGAHLNCAPNNVFVPGQTAYVVVRVVPFCHCSCVNVTIYGPDGIEYPYYHLPYKTVTVGCRKCTGYVACFTPQTGRYDVVAVASYKGNNTVYYGTGENSFAALPGSVGFAVISTLQAVSSYFMTSVGSLVPGLSCGIASAIGGLIYVPYLEGSCAGAGGSAAYNFFNNVFLPFASTYVPLFLAATIGLNAFMGNYGDFYDLLRDLLYKIGVYWIFTSAGVTIWNQSASILNGLASQILPSSCMQLLSNAIAGMLTTTGGLFALSTVSNVFGDALSQAFVFMLELTVAIFMAGLIRQVLLLTLASLIPLIAALWVFEWTRRFADIIAEIGLAFVISGVVDALILRFIITFAGGWLWLVGPIFIFVWLMMGMGVARVSGVGFSAANRASGIVQSTASESAKAVSNEASEAKERLKNYMTERKQNKNAKEIINATAPAALASLSTIGAKPKEVVNLAKDSDFYAKFDSAKQRLDKAAKEAAGLGISKDELNNLASISDEKQLNKELSKYTPQQQAAIREYLDANKEVEKYKTAEYLRNVQAGLSSLNLRGVKVDPWKVQEADEKFEAYKSVDPRVTESDRERIMGSEMFYQYLLMSNLQNNVKLGMKPREAADQALVSANMYYFFKNLTNS
jgi:hypothetical protein